MKKRVDVSVHRRDAIEVGLRDFDTRNFAGREQLAEAVRRTFS